MRQLFPAFQHSAPQRPHHPFLCRKINICRVDFTYACGKCVPFRLHCVAVGFRTSTQPHYILPSLQAYTSAQHSFGKNSFPFRRLHSFRFPQAIFQRISSGIYLFSATSKPRRIKNLNFPHRPIIVAVISGNRVLLPVLAVGAFIPAPLCSGNCVRSSLRTPTLHYAFIRASTSAPYGISSSILSLHMFRSFSPYPCHLSAHFQRLPSFLRRVCPNKADY